MAIQESGEMYLESILVLSQRLPRVRAIDVSEYMNYSKPSVSRAMSLLREEKYIEVSEDGSISLTADGKTVAGEVYEKHRIISSFLMKIGVEEAVAIEDACKIEHVISKKSFDALKRHTKDL